MRGDPFHSSDAVTVLTTMVFPHQVYYRKIKVRDDYHDLIKGKKGTVTFFLYKPQPSTET